MKDMNYDGAVTISDIGPWLKSLLEQLDKWLVQEGNWLLSKIIDTDIGVFFEVSYDGKLASSIGVVSLVIQLAFIAFLLLVLILIAKGFFDSFKDCINKTSTTYPRCITGFFAFGAFVLLIIAAGLQISWLHNSIFVVFVVSWLAWYSQGRWWGK